MTATTEIDIEAKKSLITDKLMIVEDDKTLNDGIAMTLGDYEIVQAYNLSEAEKLLDDSVDLLILDINLPDGNGLEFCRRLKEKSRVSVIFLTANDMETDIVMGLESGAADYITKPFSLAILRARVSAVLRAGRETREEREAIQPSDSHFVQGSFDFDFAAMQFTVSGTAVELSKTEQKLLRLLVLNADRVMQRELLLQRIWPDGTEYVDPNALSVTMRRLREKLRDIPVRTVYGIGYIWETKETVK